jgi:pyridoxal phosphate enzyme (YggS family)
VIEPAEIERFERARARVLERIAGACARVGREPAEVTLVAVSKTVSAERVQAAFEAGQREFGENRVQEGIAKIGRVGRPEARWRLIGPLQSNKARAAVGTFDAIDAVDSLALARRLDRLAAEVRPDRPLPVLLEVNVDRDPAKHGWLPDALERDLPSVVELRHLRVDGLMTIGRAVDAAEDARPTFTALRALRDRLRSAHGGLGGALSMGMSLDFDVAVEEGATIVRVGEALFGPRHHH